MTWTPKPPQVPGWYWWRVFSTRTGKQLNVEVVQIDVDDYCQQAGDYLYNMAGEWSGPLEPPQ